MALCVRRARPPPFFLLFPCCLTPSVTLLGPGSSPVHACPLSAMGIVCPVSGRAVRRSHLSLQSATRLPASGESRARRWQPCRARRGEQRCTVIAHSWGRAGRSRKAGRSPCGVPAAELAPVTRPVRRRFGMRTLQTPAGQRVSLLWSPASASGSWQDPPGLPPHPWSWFLPFWGDFAALLLAAEMLEQEEAPRPCSSGAGQLLQLLPCS